MMDEKRRENTICQLVDLRNELDTAPTSSRGRILKSIAAIRRDVKRRGSTATWHAINREAQRRHLAGEGGS